MLPRRLALVLPLLLLLGCASYQYDIVQPPDLAQRVGKKEITVPITPLEYRMVTVDDRLVIRIFNPTSDPIQLIGTQSSVVDAGGQAHPLRGQTAEPNSYIKLILPPPIPRGYAPGPAVGFGFGSAVIVGRHHGYGDYQNDNFGGDPLPPPDPAVAAPPPSAPAPSSPDPKYNVVYDENDTTYWDWTGQTNVRVILTFQRLPAPTSQTSAPPPPDTFRHEFVFHRVKS